MKFSLSNFWLKLFFASSFLAPLSFAEINLEEVIVTSDFREAQLKNIPTSISVIDAEIIQQRNGRHLEDLLSLTPMLILHLEPQEVNISKFAVSASAVNLSPR